MAKDKKKTESRKAEKHAQEASDANMAEDGTSKVSPGSPPITPIEEVLPVPFLPSPVPQEPKQEEPPIKVASTPQYYEEPILTQLIVERYEGEKVHGLYEGEGTAYFQGGNMYKGMFAEGIMHGRGTYLWNDGVTYEGDFYLNVPMGHGTYTWPDGSRYEGEVKNGIRHGFGMYRFRTRPVSYIGLWHQGKRHGKGTMYYSEDGTSWYEGNWVNNVKDGWGVRCYTSGNIYEGQWENSLRHGEGKMRWLTTNEEYTGKWVQGIQNGYGTHTWFLKRVPGSQYPLRNEYVGDFVNGARHGHGKFLYASGAMYEGEWNCNKKHGLGKFIFKNGRIYVGEFQDDVIAEYPHFQLDRMSTPDLSGIRTESPIGTEHIPSPHASLDISSTLGSNIELDISSLLEVFPENERPHELKQVEYAVLRHITELRRIYNSYSSLGHDISLDNTFLMTRLQFWRFLKDCRFHLCNLTLSDMDRLLNDNMSPDLLHSPHETLLLRTFLSYIIHLSFHICQQDNQGRDPSLVLCFSKIMSQNITPNACNIKGSLFCDPEQTVHLVGYINKCWEIYKNNCTKRSMPPYEDTMKMRHFLWMLKDLNIITKEVTATKIVDIFAADNPAVRDGDDTNLELEITFLEFFEALLGCAPIYVTSDIMQKSTICSLHGEATADEHLHIARAHEESFLKEQLFHQEQALHRASVENLSYETSVATYNSDSSKFGSVSDKAKKSEVKSKEHLTDHKTSRPSLKSGDKKRRPSAQPNTITLNTSLAPNQLQSLSEDNDLKEDKKEEILVQSIPALDIQEQHITSPTKETADAVKQEDKFALWLSQIYIFFIKIFFPAHEKAEHLKKEIPQTRARLAELDRLMVIKDEEEAKLRAMRKAEVEEAKRIEQEVERAGTAVEAEHVAKEAMEENKSGQMSTPPKEEPVLPPPPPPITKQAGTAGKKKKKEK